MISKAMLGWTGQEAKEAPKVIGLRKSNILEESWLGCSRYAFGCSIKRNEVGSGQLPLFILRCAGMNIIGGFEGSHDNSRGDVGHEIGHDMVEQLRRNATEACSGVLGGVVCHCVHQGLAARGSVLTCSHFEIFAGFRLAEEAMGLVCCCCLFVAFFEGAAKIYPPASMNRNCEVLFHDNLRAQGLIG